MKKILPYIFFGSWLLCGCSLDGFFNGSAPITCIAAITAMLCVFAMSK